MQVIFLVLNNVDQLEPLMDAWQQSGAYGVTFLRSAGSAHIEHALLRGDVPLFPSLQHLREQAVGQHYTLFTLVADELVDAIIAATEHVIGDLNQPHTGILFAVPVTISRGIK